MTQTQLDLGLRIQWIKHDPLGPDPILEARFWWQVPTVGFEEVDHTDEFGVTQKLQVPYVIELASEILNETTWHGTNDFGPLWTLIAEKAAELKTDN